MTGGKPMNELQAAVVKALVEKRDVLLAEAQKLQEHLIEYVNGEAGEGNWTIGQEGDALYFVAMPEQDTE